MPWNNGPWNNGGQGSGPQGSGPWGAGDSPPDPPGRKSGDNPKRPRNEKPQGPWGGPGGGSWGGRGPLPELDDLIARAQAWLGRLLPGRSPGGRGFLLLAIAVVAIWLATGFYRVEPDQQGVVLRFGAFVRTTPPGLNYHLPWPIETVELPAVTRINRTEIGYRTATANAQGEVGGPRSGAGEAVRDVPAESLMLTGDENIVDINFTVFWRIRNAPDYLFNTRHPAQTVKSAAESVMREVIGSTPIQPALTEARAKIETEVMKGTQAILDDYHAGVEIDQVQLQRVDPPAAVIDSFRDVQRANTDAERMRNEAEAYANDIVPRARGDAARIVAEAEGAKQATIATAKGESQRFLSVLTAYEAAKDVTLQRLYIETMQDVLSHTPSVVVDDKLKGLLPLLPLTGGEASPTHAPPTPAPAPKGGAK